MRGSRFDIQWNRVSAVSFVVAILATGCTSATEPLAEKIHVIRLAYVKGGQIFTTDLAGDAPRQLTSDNSGRERTPAWSADGRRIAFVRDYTSGGKLMSGAVLYLVDADGSNLVRRADGFHSPSWSPDGRRLAVTRDDCVYRCELYLVSVDDDGTPPAFVDSSAAFPAWSPDGREIAYVSLSGDDGYHALYLMDADGTNTKVVVSRDLPAIGQPTWSPDGRRIAFARCNYGECNVFTVSRDGSGLVQLTTTGDASGPAWSPDGARIAFTRWRFSSGASGASVAYVPADGGGEPTALIASGYGPAWRPRVVNRE